MNKNNKNKGVISLIVVYGVGLFALAAALTLTTGILTELIKDRNSIAGDRSFYTAESVARESVYQYVKNNTFTVDTAPFLDLNDSSMVSVENEEIQPHIYKITGVAENNLTHRESVFKVNTFPEGQAFSHAVYSENDLEFGGNVEVNGDIFANEDMEFNGASAEINGDASSANEITDTDNINGEVLSNVTPIPPPQIDLDPYILEADNDGAHFLSCDDAENYLQNQIINAVIYIEDIGETKIQGNNTILDGSLVTIGDLELSGGTYTAIGDFAAIVVEGNLRISGGTTINGVVFVKGNTSFGAGNNTINGALIVTGETNITNLTGNTTVNYDEDLAGNWQNIEGLYSAAPPQIVGWWEE